jgi:serine/threonine-protein kinase
MQVCEGLDAAHKQGIIHRDINPRNLFRSKGIWKILDFGISRLEGTDTLTQNELLGTPNYMAPEQAQAEAVDHRVDVFSLGAVLYRCLTGHPPFEANNEPARLLRLVYGRPTHPKLLSPELSNEAVAMLALALAHDPDDRFRTVADFSDAARSVRASATDLALCLRAHEVVEQRPWETRVPRALAQGETS